MPIDPGQMKEWEITMLDIRFATKSGNQDSLRPEDTGFSLQIETRLWARALFNLGD